MPDDPYILNITGMTPEEAASAPDADAERAAMTGRKWIGVQFECCGVYSRIYRNPAGTAYVGFCPRCQRRVNVPIGPGGTNARMFRAT